MAPSELLVAGAETATRRRSAGRVGHTTRWQCRTVRAIEAGGTHLDIGATEPYRRATEAAIGRTDVPPANSNDPAGSAPSQRPWTMATACAHLWCFIL
jgi:hypothetical protein